MPLYEYECGSCGHRFERIQKFSDPPEKTCPKCGGEVQKLMGAPAMQFKGSGWYVNDYGKGTKDTKGTKESKSTEATEKTGATEKSGTESSKETSTKDSGTKETKSTKDSSTPTKS